MRALGLQHLIAIAKFSVVLFVPLSASLAAAGAATDDLTIVHARIVSPPTIIDDGTIVIRDGRIVYVGSRPTEPDTKRIIDAQGQSIIPGLIDTHAHLIIGPDSDEAYDRAIGAVGATKLEDYLEAGFTTVFSMGDYWPQILEVRRKLEIGQLRGPRFLIVGPLITAIGGHPTDVFPECAHSRFCQDHWAGQVGDAEAAVKLVDQLADAGVDGIKVAFSPEGANHGRDVRALSPQIARAVIREAHLHHLRVAVYAGSARRSLEAIQMGGDWLTHPIYDGSTGLDPEGNVIPSKDFQAFIAEAKRRKTVISTTLGDAAPVVDYWGVARMAHTGERYDTMEFGAPLADLYQTGKASMRYLDQQGITLAFGLSKFRLPVPIAARTEFKALAEAGFSPEKILEIATRSAALEIGRPDLGAIEVGKRADLVMLSADPTQSIDALEHIGWVMRDGQMVYKEQAECSEKHRER